MTISSFNSLSLDPPLGLVQHLAQANSFVAWQLEAGRYAINVLSEEPGGVVQQVRRAKGEKWIGRRC